MPTFGFSYRAGGEAQRPPVVITPPTFSFSANNYAPAADFSFGYRVGGEAQRPPVVITPPTFSFSYRSGGEAPKPPVYTVPPTFVFVGAEYTPLPLFIFTQASGPPLTFLAGASCTQANVSNTQAINQSYGLTGANCTQTNFITAGVIDIAISLFGDPCTQENILSLGGVAQTYTLIADNCSQQNTVSVAEIIYTHRYLTSGWCIPSGDTASLFGETALTRQQGNRMDNRWQGQRQQASPLLEKTCFPVDQSAAMSGQACLSHGQATSLSSQASAVIEQLTPRNIKRCGTVDDATGLAGSALAEFSQLELIFTANYHPVQDSGVVIHDYTRYWYAVDVSGNNYTPSKVFVFTPPPPFDDGRLPHVPAQPPPFVFNGNYTPAPLFTPLPRLGGTTQQNAPPQQNPVFEWDGVVSLHSTIIIEQRGVIRSGVSAPWRIAKRLDVKKCFPVQQARPAPSGTSSPIDPPRPPVVDPPGHIIVTIPTKQVYSMLHTASVTLLNGAPIAMNNLSLSHNADSFAWQFSGELLRKDDIALLTQSGGTPVQLVVTINGVVFKVIPSPVEHNYRFGQRSITVPGIGLTALLDRPYEQPSSATQGSQLTIQQIAELLLPGGWTLDWAAAMPAPWLIPAEVFTYTQKTPIQALATLAQDIGCVLIPARDSQTITITPRYPKLPWNFATLSPDLVIPASAVTGVTHQTVLPEQANGVYVHCNHNQGSAGQIGWCRLNGSDGAKLAPPVGNDFMTDPIALRLLGERILAAYAPQPPIKSFTLPMDNTTFPMLSVGQFVQVTADGQTARGIVNSVSLQYSLSETDINVSQTIQIGEQTPNEWVFFRNLLPGDPLLFASLAATDGETSLMTLLDNGVVRVRGTGTVGNKYFIRAGRIDGEAPNLTQQDIVI
jgi:hypothetical protein